MRNKVLALILALVMMVSVTVMAPVASLAADGVEAIGPDTVTEAAALLMTLNVLQGYEDGSLQLENNITRAEFAAMLARMLRGTDELNLNAGAIVHDKLSETPENIAAVKAAEEKKKAGITDEPVAEGTPGESVTTTGARVYYTDINATNIAEPFSDVTSDHWAFTEVDYLRSLGIASGHNDGTFKPDDNVTYEQIIKFVVASLGYDFMAESYGGYPDGYLRTASQLKILKNVGGTVGAAATRQQVVVLLFNAITARYLVVDGIKDGNNFYETGKSLLSYVYEIDTLSGYNMTATEKSGKVLPSGACEKGKVVLTGRNTDGDLVNLDLNYYDEAVNDYLGYDLKAYVKLDEDNKTTGDLLIAFPTSTAKRVTIAAEDIISADTTRNEVEYYALDGEEYEEELVTYKSNPTVIYNGYALASGSLSDDTFDISNGYVEFVSFNNGKDYSLIVIEDYLPMYVETVKGSTQTLKGVAYKKGALNSSYEICLDNTLTTKEIREKKAKDPSFKEIELTVLDADGYESDFSAISEESVVEIRGYRAADKMHYTVYLGGSVDTGKVTKRSSDYIYIGETKYEAIKGSTNLFSSFKNGSNIKVCTTKDGYVFYAKAMQSYSDDLKYGLLVRSSQSEESFGESELKVKLFTTDGKMGIYEFAENMKLVYMDGTEYRYNSDKAGALTTDEFLNLLKESAKKTGLKVSTVLAGNASARPLEQLVKFAVNSENKIKEIVVARPLSSVPADEDPANYFTVLTDDVEWAYSNGGILYGTPYVIAESIAVRVPMEGYDYSDSDYRVGKIGTGARAGHGYVLYDIDENGKPAIFITKNEILTDGQNASGDAERTLVVMESAQPATLYKDGEYTDVFEFGIINGSAYETKYSLVEKPSYGRDFFDGGTNAKGEIDIDGNGTMKNVFRIGDVFNPAYWSSTGYLGKAYNPGTEFKVIDGGFTGTTDTGFWSIEDFITRIVKGTADQYFHVATEKADSSTWGSLKREFTFGKVGSTGSSRINVLYGPSASNAVSVDISGKRAVKYDCATGYVSIVSASEITDEDWAFVQQSYKATKMLMFFTNVEEADVANIKVGENERD